MSYLEKAKAMYDMVSQGQILEAFEKYYHTKVVMEELSEEPVRGKEANRARQIEFLDFIQEVHDVGVESIASDEKNQVTMVESWFDATYKDGNRIRMEQVAVQKWDGDHIAYEKFYHK